MADLRLYLLGSTQIELGGVQITVKPRKAFALLMYLAVTAEQQSRDFLATLLWPNSSQRRARHSLRSRLSELNITLGNDWIVADRETLRLRPDFWLDVTEFQQRVANKADHPDNLIAAINLYRNDFLTGFTLPDCPQFDEWQLFETERLRQTLATALERLVSTLSDQADLETAVPYALRRLALDPLHEPAHRQLMRLYAHLGRQAAALRQYDQCRQILNEELGVAPSSETTTLFEDIQSGKVARKKRKPLPRHNLPVQTTTFIGRENEIADISRLLLEEPGCRLLTLVGPGGIGKTRLALATAGQILDAFPDGTYFISLASVTETEYIVPTIAAILNLAFSGQTGPKAQLLNYLRSKKLLIVADNFEQLLDGSILLAEIIQQAPDVCLLVTSRERLNLREEWGYDVQGLSFPARKISNQPVDKQSLEKYTSLKLFQQRARQATAGFAPSVEETADIIRICQLVEGMPLGLELAAPWVRLMTCRQIADEIEQNLDFLTTPLINVPERHRSLRVVFEQTWQRLSAKEQTVLMRLSVFRGGCTREALVHVTGATVPRLSSLVDKALLHRTNTGRYELHELLRQYAADKLEVARQTQLARDAHCRYYADFLRQREADVKGRRQVAALDEIEADFNNVQIAWRWAASGKQYELVRRALESLYWYCVMRNRYQELLKFLRLGREQLAPAAGERPHLVWAWVMARAPSPNRVFAEPLTEVKMRLETALTIAREFGDQALEAYCLWRLGAAVFNDKDDFSEALAYCEQSLAIYQALDDQFYKARLLEHVGLWYLRLQQSERGARLIQQSTNLRRMLGDKVGLDISLRSLGWIAYHEGNFTQAESHWQESYRLARETRGNQETTYRHLGIAWLAFFNRGDFVTAQAIAEEMQTRSVEVSNREWQRQAQIMFGFLAGMAEDYAACRRFMEEAAYRRKYTYNISWMMMGLCLAACGLGEMQTARQYLAQLLEMSLARKWTAVIAQCLPFAAIITADAGEAERAVERLALAFHHPRSPKGWLKKWPLLTRLRAELEIVLSPGALMRVWEQGQALDLAAMAETLLRELSPEASQQSAGKR